MEQAKAGRHSVCWLWLVLVTHIAGLGIAQIIAVARLTDVTQALPTAAFTYDLPANARVHIHEFDAAGTDPAQLSGLREVFAPPTVEAALRLSTTFPSRNNATEAASELPGLSSSAAQLEAMKRRLGCGVPVVRVQVRSVR